MRYQVDARRSRFIAQAFASGLLSAFGHNPKLAIRDFEGEAEFDPTETNAAWAKMTARADSLVVIDEITEKDRREIERVTREEILQMSRYPEIFFRSDHVESQLVADGRYQMRITGDLSIRGVTRKVTFDAMAFLSESELRADGGFSLRLTDFNIRPVSVAGGLLKLKDEVRLSFDILARALSATAGRS